MVPFEYCSYRLVWDENVIEPALTWDLQIRHSQSQPIVRLSVTDQRQFDSFNSHWMHEFFAYRWNEILSTLNTSFTFFTTHPSKTNDKIQSSFSREQWAF